MLQQEGRRQFLNLKFGVVVPTWLAPEAAHFSKDYMCIRDNTLLSLDFTRSGWIKLTIKRKVVDHF